MQFRFDIETCVSNAWDTSSNRFNILKWCVKCSKMQDYRLFFFWEIFYLLRFLQFFFSYSFFFSGSSASFRFDFRFLLLPTATWQVTVYNLVTSSGRFTITKHTLLTYINIVRWCSGSPKIFSEFDISEISIHVKLLHHQNEESNTWKNFVKEFLTIILLRYVNKYMKGKYTAKFACVLLFLCFSFIKKKSKVV